MANIISYLFSAADASGHPLIGAQVSITYLSPDIGFPPIGTIYGAQTQANGAVTMNVPEGVYDISVAKAGYTTYTQQSLALHEGGSSAITLQGSGPPPPSGGSPDYGSIIGLLGIAGLTYYLLTT
jgi:hypothetical protein